MTRAAESEYHLLQTNQIGLINPLVVVVVVVVVVVASSVLQFHSLPHKSFGRLSFGELRPIATVVPKPQNPKSNKLMRLDTHTPDMLTSNETSSLNSSTPTATLSMTGLLLRNLT